MKIVSIIIILLISLNVYTKEIKHNFLPENNLWLEDSFENKSNIDEETFDYIIDTIKSIYQPIARKNKLSLGFLRHWDDPKVNASCSRLFRRISVNIYGGLARRKELSPEGLVLIICHELGHAFGGKPFASRFYKLAAEGQSDYYSAGVCAKKVFKKLNIDSGIYLPTAFEKSACEKYSGDYDECLTVLTGGDSLAHLLASFRKTDIIPAYETPDLSVVKRTNVSYPSIQCRIDTYMDGLFDTGRPSCWFKK